MCTNILKEPTVSNFSAEEITRSGKTRKYEGRVGTVVASEPVRANGHKVAVLPVGLEMSM
jgi:hypothetical protein